MSDNNAFGDAAGSDTRVGPIAWIARDPIAANLLMVILLLGGFWAAVGVQKEVFPSAALDVVEVRVGYPGAAPTEVERGILRPVEEAIRGVDGVRDVISNAREGSGSVDVGKLLAASTASGFQDIDAAVSRIRTFPDDIEQPEVRLRARQQEVMSIVLYGPVDTWTLRGLAERLRDELVASESISQVELGRVSDYVTHVEIPRDRLREYGLTLGDVARKIEVATGDLVTGAVETNSGEILLRVKARKQFAEQFEDVEIVAEPGGAVVTLGDIGTVRDGFAEEDFPSQFNQTPSVELEVYRVGEQSPLDVAEAVEATLANFEQILPPGVAWRTDSNAAEDFSRRLTLVTSNGLMAVVIVLLILSLFLEFRLAFWVMLGMAVSFIGGLLFLPVAGVSINMISLFGFLIVLGIVVDDAVVVGENVYERRQSGESAMTAAIRGTREISGPVVFSILTNIVAFVPLMFIPGETGQFWKPLPIIVIIILLVSLLEAVLLPAHLAHLGRPATRRGIRGRLHAAQQGFSKLFSRGVETLYRPVLALALRFRYITATAALSLLFVVGGYATGAHMGMILMPEVSADEIEAGVRLPGGTTPAEQAAKVAADVTAASLRMFEEHDLDRVAEGIKTNVRGGGSFVDVEIVMRPPDERDMTASQVIDLWRDSIGDLPGVDQITFEAERGPGGWRRDIAIALSHSDTATLKHTPKHSSPAGGVRQRRRCQQFQQSRQNTVRLPPPARRPGTGPHARRRRPAGARLVRRLARLAPTSRHERDQGPRPPAGKRARRPLCPARPDAPHARRCRFL